jgi:two-component system, OmpR family, phosphate regulon sensor histidine kinase PhoR
VSAKPYKFIFVSLIASVVCILALQGFWIRNFYLQKEEEFKATVYSALEKAAVKITERKNLQKLRQKITIHKEKIQPGGKKNAVLVTKSATVSNYAQVRNPDKKEDIDIRISDVSSIQNEMPEIKIGDSSIRILSDNPGMITRSQTLQTSDGKNDEVNKLMDKMLMEVKIVDSDEKHPDTLNNIIKRVFENKGLFLPYEFAMKKIFKNKDETLASSKGFSDKQFSFVTDLSANKVFSTHNYLLVQFPNGGTFVFDSMRNMLLLSLLFSLVIIGVFYYTIRLIIKQKKLGEMKNDFINNMTHELKTPIATISLATEAINNPLIKDNDEKFKDYTRILKEENQKLNSHVERVLEMAMLDKGELVLNKKQVNIGKLIQRTIESHKLLIQKQNAKVNFSPDTEVICRVDEEHMLAAFNNLLDNALKYSKEFCTVNIQIARPLKDLVITFKDNGIGIDKEQKEKVFDKFFRAQGGNLHDVKGFGLGLSYVRSIVEAHNGSIELLSEKGKGSEFIIKLPSHA